ncbi:hypothetical protein SODG_000772 [Sodalis praecaptivus]
MFTLFSYIAPLLLQVTHISDRGVSWTLFLIGAGLTVGNLLGDGSPIGGCRRRLS